MHNGKDEDIATNDFEDDPVIADSQLPVTLQGLPQGFAVLMWSPLQAGLNGFLDSLFYTTVQSRDILLDFRMVKKLKGQAYQISSCGRVDDLENVLSLFSAI